MKTAYYLLKDHSSFNSIQFVVVPYCREHLHTAGDVPLPYSTCVELAQSLFPIVDTESHFRTFSAGAMREAYFLEDLDLEPQQ